MLFTVYFFNLIAGWYLHGSRSTSAKKLFEEFQNNPSEAMHVKSDTSNENSLLSVKVNLVLKWLQVVLVE